MSGQFFCAHCDETFVPEDKKARCPTCMRKGIVLTDKEEKASTGGPRRGIAIVAALLVLGVGAFAVYRSMTPTLEATPPLRPLSAQELAAYLERDQIDAGIYASMFALPDQVDGYPDGVDAAAQALRGRTTPWSLEQTLPRAVATADGTLSLLSPDGARERVYPLEAAVSLAAILRQRGLPAMVADVGEFQGERAPADPSGTLGYYVVAIYDEDAETPSQIVDPWGGRSNPNPEPVRVLRDTEVVGAALGIQAARTFASSGDAKVALPTIETALDLDPVSPTLRETHAVVLSESGGLPQALRELEAALQLRPDGPRKLTRVQLTLAQGVMAQASGQPGVAEAAFAEANRLLTEILEEWPRYSRAHIHMATMYLGNRNLDRARVELETARSLGSDSPMLSAVWAQYHADNGQRIEAATRMSQAISLDPENWQLRTQAAGVFLEIDDTERARQEANEALGLVTGERKKQLQAYFEQIGVFRGASLPSASPGGLDLELGGTVPDGTSAGEGGPALMLGDPSNLKLRDPGQKLELDLDD